MFPSPPQKTFRENLTWPRVGGVLFLAACAGGASTVYHGHALDRGYWTFFTLSLLLFLCTCVWAASHRITIHAEGISSQSLLNETDLYWNEIAETRYNPTSIRSSNPVWAQKLVSQSRFAYAERSLQVIGPRSIVISSSIRNYREAMRLVLERVDSRLRQEAERQLTSGGTIPFGNLALSPEGVIWPGKEPIPYNAIVECALNGPFLQIKAEGKPRNKVIVSAGGVPNIFVFLDLVEQRRNASGRKTAAARTGSSSSQYL